MRFLAVIRGARTPAPKIDTPVIQIPLPRSHISSMIKGGKEEGGGRLDRSSLPPVRWAYHPAPATLSPMLSATPTIAKV
jgi:hypothetical protein